MLRTHRGSLVVLILVLIASTAHASYTVYGSGTGTGGEAISASADLSFVSYDFVNHMVTDATGGQALQITLTNTSPSTSYRGNLLTGYFFSLDGVTALTTDDTGFDGLARTVRNGNTATFSNVDLAPAKNGTATDGMYQLANGPFGTANSGLSYADYAFGIGTVGFGLAGFSGAATDGDNYGIAAAGSDLTLDGLPSAQPVIDTSANFWILLPSSIDTRTTSPNTLVTNSRFAFGSLPDNATNAEPPAVVPEPSTFILFGIGMACMVCLRKKRQKA